MNTSYANMKILQLECEGTVVNLEVTEDDFNRASTDLVYAQELFNEYEHQNVTAEQENKENDAFWSEAETLLFISLYENHKDDFHNAKKRKKVWIMIVEEMAAHNYFRTAEKIERKWANLMRMYRAVKDNRGPRKTGRSALNYKYYDRLDEILGDKPSNATSSNIIDVGVNEEVMPARESNVNDTTNVVDEASTSESGSEIREIVKNDIPAPKKPKITEKGKRHKERLEIENKKIEIEQRKVQLLEKLLEKMSEEKKCYYITEFARETVLVLK